MAQGMTVKFGADTTQFTKGLDRMQKKTKSTASSIKSSMAKMLGAGLIIAGIRSITEELDRAGKLARRFGTDAVTIQKLSHVAKLGAVDIEVMADALKDANIRAEEAAAGSETAAAGFKAMGIDAVAFKELGMEDQFLALADGYNTAEAAGQGFSTTQKVMGENGVKLIPIFKDGSAAIKEFADSTAVASNDTVEKVQDMNDSLTEAKNLIVGFAAATFETLSKTVPLFRRVGDAIHNFIKIQVDLAIGSVQRLFTALKLLASGDLIGSKEAFEGIFTNVFDEAKKAQDRFHANNKRMVDSLIDAEIAAKTKGLKRVAKIEEDLTKKGFESRRRIHLAKVAARAAEEAKEEEDAKTKATTKSPSVTSSRERGQEISSLASMGGGRGFVGGMSGLTKAALQGNKILTNIHNELKKPQGGLA